MLLLDLGRPRLALAKAFVAWKSLLLLMATAGSLGPPYDTSTTLMMESQPRPAPFGESPLHLATRLTRWDAIYFVQSARRGYVYEQEWAFGRGLPIIIAWIVRALAALGIRSDESLESAVGVGLSHLSHLLSVLALYQLGLSLYRDRRVSFVAALLHVLSPAGLFLSAPYAESTFSLFTFVGMLLFARGCRAPPRDLLGDGAIVASGAIFGLTTTMRSNGILNGIPFAVYAIAELLRSTESSSSLVRLRRLAALGIGGLSVAMGSIGPQAMAYKLFCSGPSVIHTRPWCAKWLPSIYTFVQERYWNVGFLRYWTPGNIPLFLLAAPMVYLLMRSGWETLITMPIITKPGAQVTTPSNAPLLVAAMAASQLVLAALAVTTYHIQVITRLSSGYPLWYFWLAQQLGASGDAKTSKASGVVTYMVMYAAIQGALFASFLPPA